MRSTGGPRRGSPTWHKRSDPSVVTNDSPRAGLAEKTGVDQGDISRIEGGSIFPNEKTA